MCGMEYRHESHTIFQIEYRFVSVTKYRYKVLSAAIAERVRDLVRETCEAFAIRPNADFKMEHEWDASFSRRVSGL